MNAIVDISVVNFTWIFRSEKKGVIIMKMSRMQRVLSEAEFEVRSYSGRGMFNKSCLGVSVDSSEDLGDMLGFLMDACGEDPDASMELSRDVRDIRWDTLGLGMIFYFPNVAYVNPDDADDEDLDDESESDDDDSDESEDDALTGYPETSSEQE